MLSNLDYTKALIFKEFNAFNNTNLIVPKIVLLDKMYGINLGYFYKVFGGKIYNSNIIKDVKELQYVDTGDLKLNNIVVEKIKKINSIQEVINEGKFKEYIDDSVLTTQLFFEALALIIEVYTNINLYSKEANSDIISYKNLINTSFQVLNKTVSKRDVEFIIEVLAYLSIIIFDDTKIDFIN